MSVINLIKQLNDLSIGLELVDGKLRIQAPKGVLTDELKSQLRDYKPELIKVLERAQSQSSGQALIQKVEGDRDLPLSYAQQRMWLLNQIEPESAAYHVNSAFILKGQLNQTALQKALDALLCRHAILRTVYQLSDVNKQQPVQRINDDQSVPIDVFDGDVSVKGFDKNKEKSSDKANKKTSKKNSDELVSDEVRNWLKEFSNKPFDLSRELMLRMQLVAIDDQTHIIQWVIHHIAVDAWSMGILSQEFAVLYQFALDNLKYNAQELSTQLSEPALQYADFAHWQREFLEGDQLQSQLNFWKEQLGDEQPIVSLPTLNSYDTESVRKPTRTSLRLSSSISDNIQSLSDSAQAQRITPHVFLLAAFQKLLHDYSGQTDIRIGVPTANRQKQEIQSLVGCFVNTFIMKAEFDNTQTVAEYFQQCQQQSFAAQDNQDVPFEMLVDELVTSRDMQTNPLFQVMFNYLQQDASNSSTLNDIIFEPIELEPQAPKFDLSLLVQAKNDDPDNGDNLSFDCVFEYDGTIYSSEFIKQFVTHYETLLGRLIDAKLNNSECALNEINGLTKEDLERANKNQTERNIPVLGVEQLFNQQANLHPENIAASFEEHTLSYAELDAQSNQLARALIAAGVKPNQLVGICQYRSLPLLVSVLAVFKAGAAYVPLDPNYPPDRVAYMMGDADLCLLLTDQEVIDNSDQVVDGSQCPVINVSNHEALKSHGSSAIETSAKMDDLAYVIYTSGSTGLPKGVKVTRANLTNFIIGMQDILNLNEEDRLLAVTSLSFDIATLELYLPLVCGAQVLIGDESLSMDGPRLNEIINQGVGISVMQATPVTWKLLLASGFQLPTSKKGFTALCGGEAFPIELAKSLVSLPINVWNVYGPTETTVWSSAFELSKSPDTISNTVPIGHPIANTQMYVLNEVLKPVPQGAVGELYIGGSGVAQGYLGQDALADERFINTEYGRIYQTGDLARYRYDGVLECLGRIDSQVKIRGYRIELGEIESSILQHESVTDVAVNPHDLGGEPVLVAYIVLADQKTVSNDELKKHIGQTLPNYMEPSFVVELDQLPLTPNGKVDRKALPKPDASTQQKKYVAPTSDTEHVLCDIWQDVLDLEQVGVEDNFFELGGHSLLVIRVITLLQEHSINVDVRDLFALPCLKDLAFSIDQSIDDGSASTLFRAPERLIPQNCQQVTPPMLPLITLNQTEIDLISNAVPGGMENIVDIYPLGPLQEGIYFHHLMSRDNDPYVFPNLLKISSKANLDRFLEALQFIINRHEVLRTMVLSEDLPQAVQVVCKDVKLPVVWLDLEGDVESQMQIMCDSNQWLDVNQAPLLRVCIAQEGEHYHVLLQYHHLISDHEGLAIIQRELMAFFSGFADALPAPIPYREFVAHAQHQLENGDAKQFFSDMLADVDEPSLPFGLTNTQNDGNCIVDHRQMVDAEVAKKIRTIAKTMHLNPASLFHAAWAMVISACSGQEQVVFGSVLSGRLQGTVGAEHMMGVFINTLPIRVDVNHRNMADYVQAVHTSLTDLLSYEQTPLVLAQNCSQISSEQPLFSALMNYRHSGSNNQDQQIQDSQEKSQSIDGVEFVNGVVRNNYPLTLSIDDYGDQGFGLAGLFDQSIDADRLLAYVQKALNLMTTALLDNSASAVNQLSIISEQEQASLLTITKTKPPITLNVQNIQTLFESQVSRSPDNDALVFNDERLSYQSLNEKANQLAHYLREQGITTESRVALYMDRSPSLIISILAVLKVGACYLPLDTQWPSGRITDILEDAQAALVLTEQHLQANINGLGSVACFAVDQEDVLDSQPHSNLEHDSQASDAAYIIYTSGSTGKPKGVVIEHRQLFNYLSGVNQRLEFSGMSFAHISTVAADLGNTGLFGALCYGGALHLIDSETAFDADKTAQTLASYPVDALKVVPGHLQGLLAAENAKDVLPKKLLITGGEACPIELIGMVKAINPSLKIVNHYGPSETTVGVLTHEITPDDIQAGRIPIGKPISNTQALILDTAGKLAPVGVSGELFIGGASVARGYLNRQELTQERFVDSQYCSGRLYRTGDLVCMRDDGSIEFLGRIDNQVKVRGYRVELGDIESCLLEQSNVEQAVVLLLESDLNSRLIAFLQLKNQHADGALDEIKAWLEERLPEYMLPQDYDVLESITRTANGKVDRNALIEYFEGRDQDQSNQSVQPRNDIEIILATVWEQVLQRDGIGIHDDFFAIGGDSILSLQVIARAKKQGIKLTPRIIFDQPTIAQLAEHAELINNEKSDVVLAPLTGSVLLTPIQRWFFDANQPNKNHWNQSVIFNVLMPLNVEALQKASLALISHHDALRLRFDCFCDQWSQHYEALDAYQAENVCQRVSADDLSLTPHSSTEQISGAIEAKANQLQRSLNIEKGDVFRLAYFSLSEIEGQSDRLLIIIHHLAIDGVSWRVLVNDLYQLYQQSLLQKPFDLGEKSASFQQWSQQLMDYAQSPQVQSEIDYWRSVFDTEQDSAVQLLSSEGFSSKDFSEQALDENIIDTQQSLSFSLNLEQTLLLLQDAPAVYGAQINDLLLSALAASFCQQGDSLLIEMEGHGRELLTGQTDLDLSQTVGWFTSRFPTRITNTSADTKELVHDIKNQLSQIPNKGIGYGVVRYLHENFLVQDEFAKHPSPLISFNYLGQFDGAMDQAASGLLSAATESTGCSRDELSKRSQVLEIVGQVTDQRLSFSLQYSSALNDEKQIQELVDRYHQALISLVNDCAIRRSKQSELGAFDLAITQSEVHATQKAKLQTDQLQLIRPAIEAVSGETGSPVFCLHHRGGHTREYRQIAEQFDAQIPVYGIQSPALSDASYNEQDISVVAEHYADLIQSVQADGSYRLLGWSLGGVLAMAITEVLEARGHNVTFLGLIDAMLPQSMSDFRYQSDSLLDNLLAVFGAQAAQRYAQVEQSLRESFEQTLQQLDEDNALQFACDWIVKLGMVDESVFDQEYLKLHYRTAVQSKRLIQSYKPKKSTAKANIWWARNSLNADNNLPPTDWQQYCAGVLSEQIIEGGHFDIIQDTDLKQSVAQCVSAGS